MSNIQFGSGVLHMKPVAGNTATNPTPFRAGILQEVQVDFKGDLKMLYGSSQFAEATARGKVSVSVKGKFAAFDPNMWNQVFWGQTATTGIKQVADQEAGTIPSTPFQITVANSANFLNPDGDLGVQNASTGAQLTKVASGPATGQYSVAEATGIYTFAAADTGNSVLISYLWSNTTRGTTIALTKQNMGFAPEIEMSLFGLFRTKYLGLRLFDVTLGSMSLPTKQEDFWISDFDGSANANAAGLVAHLYGDNS